MLIMNIWIFSKTAIVLAKFCKIHRKAQLLYICKVQWKRTLAIVFPWILQNFQKLVYYWTVLVDRFYILYDEPSLLHWSNNLYVMFATVSVLLKKDNKNIQFDLFGYINLNFISKIVLDYQIILKKLRQEPQP